MFIVFNVSYNLPKVIDCGLYTTKSGDVKRNVGRSLEWMGDRKSTLAEFTSTSVPNLKTYLRLRVA